MKQTLTIRMSESRGVYIVRCAGYKASSTQSYHIAARRLIRKIHAYEPAAVEISRTGAGPSIGPWTLTWEEAA